MGLGPRLIWATGGDVWVRVGEEGGFSHESEHDLAVMVSDFLENGSSGSDSWCSSDSDSNLSDLANLSDKITLYKRMVHQYECDLLAVVHSLLLSIGESDLHFIRDGPCNASCIRQSLVKLLKLSGYNAALCISKWEGFDKVPGGDHEYVTVILDNDIGGSERLIIDIDFRSHFEIARAVDSYDKILKMLPVVYVGSWPRLKQLLQVMVEAARSSLKQNSMPLPPWRSLSYLQAKWHSANEITVYPDEENDQIAQFSEHTQCLGRLRRLKSSLHPEIDKERLMKSKVADKARRGKLERRRTSLLRV